MNVQKFFQTLRFITETETTHEVQSKLEAVNTSLINLVSSPTNPTYQAALAAAMVSLSQAVAELVEDVSVEQEEDVLEVGGKYFFDPELASKIKNSISANAMTPSVVSDYVKELTSHRFGYLSTVEQTLDGLESLGVSSDEPEPGSTAVSFIVPRELFKNELAEFSKQLNYISRLILCYSEAITGKPEAVKLNELSCSNPTVVIAAGVKVVSALATVVALFLTTWEKVERFRKLRAEIIAEGLSKSAVDEFTERIETTVTETIEESTQLVLKDSKVDSGRKNELESAIRQETKRLFGQIERGLKVNFRATIDETASAPVKAAIEAVNYTNRDLRFPEPDAEPVLLTNGEVIEGTLNIKTVTKKTTTTKSVTKKSSAPKSAKGSAKKKTQNT
jgi:hypothetical protein